MAGKLTTIAVVTGSRAESGLLVSTMHAVRAHPKLRLRIVAAGSLLVQGAWRELVSTGFTIDTKVRMQTAKKIGRSADVAALGRGVAGFGKAFDQLMPDCVVVLGDRIEVLAAASAASIGGFRLAHIHGGDRAEGVADEAIRHAVSKLSHIHFTATAQSRGRLIRMGEDPKRVYLVGSPAIDGLKNIESATDAPKLIVMQHPIGGSDKQEADWMRATLRATESYDRLVMMPNLDPGRDGICRAIRDAKITPVEHLPREQFLAQLKGASVIVGNSSAGLIEASALRVPCVDIGPRQAGRQNPGNVISCHYGESPVARAVRRAMKLDLRRMRHPYGDGRAGHTIAKLLSSSGLRSVPPRKQNTY
jgi:UDP-hydrolysing UDP-N-acetyl-D-glucosamine 2-epimerase